MHYAVCCIHYTMHCILRYTQCSIQFIILDYLILFKPGECRNLQELNLSGVSNLTANVISGIGVGCKNLLYLNLANCLFDDGVLRMLAR